MNTQSQQIQEAKNALLGRPKKSRIIDVGDGKFQRADWHVAADHHRFTDIDVAKFEKQYGCHPLEAHAFYPEEFNLPLKP